MNNVNIPAIAQANPDEKFRVSLSVSEMEVICSALSIGEGALDNLALIQRLHKTMAKASVGAVMAAYAGSTKQPGMATMQKIQRTEKEIQGAALLAKLHTEQPMSDDEVYEAMNYLIEVMKSAPSHATEIAALDTYMTMKIQKSISG